VAIRRIDWSVDSHRSFQPTESPRQGSSTVAPVCGNVSIRPSVGTPLANTTRCSECTLKKSSATSTIFVQTSSASSGGSTTALRGAGGGPGMTGPPGPMIAASGSGANGLGC